VGIRELQVAGTTLPIRPVGYAYSVQVEQQCIGAGKLRFVPGNTKLKNEKNLMHNYRKTPFKYYRGTKI
jgi:hypothetical protein